MTVGASAWQLSIEFFRWVWRNYQHAFRSRLKCEIKSAGPHLIQIVIKWYLSWRYMFPNKASDRATIPKPSLAFFPFARSHIYTFRRKL